MFSITVSSFRFLHPVALISGIVLLSGCSSYSWSNLSPTSWFGSDLVMTENGVGEVGQQTPMTEQAIKAGLDSDYIFRAGMQTEKGTLVKVFQGMREDKVEIEIYGPESGTVSSISVSDEKIKTAWGPKVGSEFSAIYEKAFGSCELSDSSNDTRNIMCQSPDSQRVRYVFSGKWSGPEGLMPPDDVLKTWKISRIIWHS